jgi:hypothetical protein
MKILPLSLLEDNVVNTKLYIVSDRYWWPQKDEFLYCFKHNDVSIFDLDEIFFYENQLLRKSAGDPVNVKYTGKLELELITITNIVSLDLKKLLKE